MVDTANFDLSQISDIVSRNKFSDKRKRNEMVRLGTSDPNSFAMQNQQQLQQAEQPTEFWGAGRKEAMNQAPDVDAANFVGGISNLGGKYYYYGDKDTSTAQWGTKGYNTQDLGKGLYSIMDQSGTNLGTGYNSVADSINAYRQANIPNLVSENIVYDGNEHYPQATGKTYTVAGTSPLGPMWGGTTYDTYEEALAAAQRSAPSYQRRAYNGGALEDWEILSQLMSGTGGMSNFTSGNRYVPTDNINQTISGLNTLYGSTPLLWNNKLVGYGMDITPLTGSESGYVNPNLLQRIDNKGSVRSSATLAREYLEPDKWSQLGSSYGDGNYYIPVENADKLPGWTQYSDSKYAKQSNGLFGKAFDFLDPILDKLDPMHNTGQDLATSILGKDSQKETFNTVAPIVASFFGGWGALANAANSASLGDGQGALLSTLGAMGQFSGFNPTAALGNQFQSAGLSPAMASAASKFATSALTNAARGGDLKSSLASALFSTAGGAAGDALSKATEGSLGDIGSKMLGGAASGGINSLFTKNSPISGSLYGAMSGGLHGFLNSTARENNQFNSRTDLDNKAKAQSLSNLFKQSLANRNK